MPCAGAVSEHQHEQFCHDVADDAAAGEREHQVSIMSRTTTKLMAERRRTAPTPMMALVLVCVVETGMPVTEESSRQPAAARSAEKP